jgi:hypothetical protein
MPTLNKLSSRAGRLIVNGWALSTIVTVASGQPVTPLISGYPSGAPDGGVTGGVSYAGAVNGRAGWLPRNGFNFPGYRNVDFRLGRQFSFGERVKLALIGEAFNLFNHTNVSVVNTAAYYYAAAGSGNCLGHTNGCFYPNATFMAPTSTSNLIWGPRQLQVSGKVTF